MNLSERQKALLKRSRWTLYEAAMIFSGIDPISCGEKTPKALTDSEFADFNNVHYSQFNAPPREDTGYSYDSGWNEWAMLVGAYSDNLHLLVNGDDWQESDSPKNWITRAKAQGIDTQSLPMKDEDKNKYFYIDPQKLRPKPRTLNSEDREYANLLRQILDASNPRHCPQLAIAITAWKEVAIKGKRSAKQSVIAWLEKNYPSLSGDATERIAMTVNWEPGGGAPRTE